MNQKQAEYFLEIARCGSVTTAAKHLFISQPALSLTMKNLENELQFPLFIPGSAQLTKKGADMIDIAQNIIAFNKSVHDRIITLQDSPSYSLRFGVLPGQARQLIPYIAKQERFSRSKIIVSESGSRILEQNVLDNKLEMAIIDGSPTRSDLEYVPLIENDMVIVAHKNSEFAKNHPNNSTISFCDLNNQRFIIKHVGSYCRFLLDTYSQLYKVALQAVYVVDNLESILNLFPELNCMTFMPLSFYRSLPWLTECANFYYVSEPGAHYKESLCYRKNIYKSEFFMEFIDHIQYFFKAVLENSNAIS